MTSGATWPESWVTRTMPDGEQRADALITAAPARSWQRLSTGAGGARPAGVRLDADRGLHPSPARPGPGTGYWPAGPSATRPRSPITPATGPAGPAPRTWPGSPGAETLAGPWELAALIGSPGLRGRLGYRAGFRCRWPGHGAERGRDAQRRTAYGSAVASAVPAGSGWALAARMAWTVFAASSRPGSPLIGSHRSKVIWQRSPGWLWPITISSR